MCLHNLIFQKNPGIIGSVIWVAWNDLNLATVHRILSKFLESKLRKWMKTDVTGDKTAAIALS
jgi:hypothetical protein